MKESEEPFMVEEYKHIHTHTHTHMHQIIRDTGVPSSPELLTYIQKTPI